MARTLCSTLLVLSILAGTVFSTTATGQVVTIPPMVGMPAPPGLRLPGGWHTAMTPGGVVLIPGMSGLPASYGVFWMPSTAGLSVGGEMYGSMGMFGMFPLATMFGVVPGSLPMTGIPGPPGLRVPGVWQSAVTPSGVVLIPGMSGLPASYGVFWMPGTAGLAGGGEMYGSMGMFGMIPMAAIYGVAPGGLSTFGWTGPAPGAGMLGQPVLRPGAPSALPLTGFFTIAPHGDVIFYPDPPMR